MTDKTKYRATMSLEQEGLTGEVTPHLSFEPEVNPQEEQHPAIYEYMSNQMLRFLRMVGIIDSNNRVIDETRFDSVQLRCLSDDDNGETRQ